VSQLLSLQSAIDQFCVAGKQRGWAPTTQIKYRKFLRYLSDWLRMRGLENTDDLSKALLRQWGADIQDEWGPETVATAVRVVRYWLHWCADEGMASPELVDCLRSPKLPKVIHRTVTPEEIQAMLAVCDTNSQNITIARRNAAIIAMLFDSMVRAAELLALDVSDLDLKGKVIVKGKGGVWRPAFFGADTVERLLSWLEVHPGHSPLFTTTARDGRVHRLGYGGLVLVLSDLADRAGIPHLSPHAFRRGGACAAVMLGASTRVVMGLGGWETLEMVVRYTRALKPELLASEYSPMGAVSKEEDKHS
jgi:integrase/recombinase XerC